MNLETLYQQNPFKIIISFDKIIQVFTSLTHSPIAFQADYAKAILRELEKYPQLIRGVESFEELYQYEAILKILLADFFPSGLTNNEIKALSIPFTTHLFNKTQRFEKILNEAGPNFNPTLEGISEDYFFIMSCCVILKTYFKANVEISDYPIHMEIPDQSGALRHYRVLYNGEFLEVIPTDKALLLSQEDISQLLDNFDDIKLWRTKFPNHSWLLKGFALMSLYDATTENALSSFKTNLLNLKESEVTFNQIEDIFRTIYRQQDLKLGFTLFGFDELRQHIYQDLRSKIYSHLLHESSPEHCRALVMQPQIISLLKKENYLVVSDINKYERLHPEYHQLIEQMRKSNAASFILIPLWQGDQLLGILELSSHKNHAFNTLNAHKLSLVKPLIVETLAKAIGDNENQIEAIIQREYTAIHPSVKWKFQQDVIAYLQAKNNHEDYIFNDVVFEHVYPLYGQIDVQSSSVLRHEATQSDLIKQLIDLHQIISQIAEETPSENLNQMERQLLFYIQYNTEQFTENSENLVLDYLRTTLHPILLHYQKEHSNATRYLIEQYFTQIDTPKNGYYQRLKDFDESIAWTNKRLASTLDQLQIQAQEIFPHYYERFKTDGIEFNLYIGQSITKQKTFTPEHLQTLRLWQMQAMCIMENEFQQLKTNLAFSLEVRSLLLAYSVPIGIRFRMDEKRFDIDGSYNVLYEIAKKRIDKAHIKNTTERITKAGYLTIVYSQNSEGVEYMGYIKQLADQGLLETTIQMHDLEDLQGLSGMKALRVAFIYPTKPKY